MREHELQLILKWVGLQPNKLITEQMILDAMQYDMGFTDGRN